MIELDPAATHQQLTQARAKIIRLQTMLDAAGEVVAKATWLVGNHAAIGDCTCRDALACSLTTYDQAREASP